MREALEEAIHHARDVLAADGVDATQQLDLDHTVQLLSIALAPMDVLVLDRETNKFKERRTSESTWISLAMKAPGLTFTSMWDRTLAAGRERRRLGELSWLDEFVLEGSCRGWAVRGPNDMERHLSPNSAVGVPVGSAPIALRRWLVARYDRYVQSILCDNYSRRSWWREFGTASDASLDFWGFYSAARWDFTGLFRARYLGLAALSTHLFLQARAWALQHERRGPSGESLGGDGAGGGGPSSPLPPVSTSAFMDAARDCIDRHKSQFGPEVQAWVELNVSLCHASPMEFASARAHVPQALRVSRSLAYERLKRFRATIMDCIEGKPTRIEKGSGTGHQGNRSARGDGASR